jgi:Ca2+-transporting ATPase
MIDPARPEAKDAVKVARDAGLRSVMVTGDHKDTATAIAREIGILTPGGLVLTGSEMDKLSDAELVERAESLQVCCRVSAHHKTRIIDAMKARGHVVAMTGDGVNDAPALKRADIGVAMGITGTDVSKQTADMVLTDDNFASIVAAIEQGRIIYSNIRKFIYFLLACNVSEVLIVFGAMLAGMPIPLRPVQLLWLNLVTDGAPALALGVEPVEPGAMRRPPRPLTESMFAHGLWQHIIWVGLLLGGTCLVTQAWAWHTGSPRWQSMTFTVLALSQLGHLLAIRSEREPAWRGFLSNPALLGTVLLTVVLQLATLYLPVFNTVLHTAPLTAGELAFCLAMSSVGFLAVEAEKALVRRGVLYRESVMVAKA